MIRFWLSDENNISTKAFTIGSTIFIQGRGLHPSTLYDFHLWSKSTERATTLLARYSTDRHGDMPAIPLIPYAGVFKHVETYPQADANTHGKTVGRTFFIRAEAREKTGSDFESLSFTVMPQNRERWIFSCDANGQPQTGIERGDGPLSLAFRNFPAGCVRVFLVPRRFRRRVGDLIDPVATRKGAICRVFHHDGSAERIVKLAESDEIPAGSYQFIARSLPVGWLEAEENMLLADDVISDHQFASLVIRLPFNKRFDHDSDLVQTPEIAERQPAHRLCSNFGNNLSIRTGFIAALDPEPLQSSLVNKRAAMYVIRPETAAQWPVHDALRMSSAQG